MRSLGKIPAILAVFLLLATSGYSLATLLEVDLGGRVFDSSDGSSWSQLGTPGTGLRYVATAEGIGTTGGYSYLLRSDGMVYFTDRGTNGWYQYGYGAPEIPGSSAYVDIAAGEGTTAGYIYVLRNDGMVYFTDRGTNGWYQYGYGAPALPSGTSWIGLTAGAETTSGYIYILRSDGQVYFTDRGTNGWYEYGYGAPNIPGSTAYEAITAGMKGAAGYIYVLRNDGNVYFTDRGTNGWVQYGYGTPALPTSNAYVDLAAGGGTTTGYIYILRNDGNVYFTDRGVNGWNQYGYGSPEIPTSTAYLSISAGRDNLAGYVRILNLDGNVYFTDRGTNGWNQYGYGSPALPEVSGFAGIAGYIDPQVFALKDDGTVYKSTDGGQNWGVFGDAGDGNSFVAIVGAIYDPQEEGYIFVLRNDGTVFRSPGDSAFFTAWGDAGTDTSWVSLGSDHSGYIYALRVDGTVAYATTSSSTWTTKGAIGGDASFTGIAAFNNSVSHYVYAMRNDRTISRAVTGTDTSWISWASSGTGSSWTSISLDESYVYTLRTDGTVDRAAIEETPTWDTSFGDVADDTAHEDVTTPLPNFPPPRPPTLTAEIWGDNITLNWTAPTAFDLSHYFIYRADTVDGFTFEPSQRVYNSSEGGSPLATTWNDTTGLADGNDYFYVLRSVDTILQESQNAPKAGKVVIPLLLGWNVLSIPLTQSDTALAKVLTTIDGSYDKVWAQDNGNKTWKDSDGDLTDLNHTAGLRVHMSQAADLKVVGVIQESTDIQLYAGWNFVGYPSITTQGVTEALSGITYDSVYTYDATDAGDHWKQQTTYKPAWMNDLSDMEAGRGYWVRVDGDQTWSVAGE